MVVTVADISDKAPPIVDVGKRIEALVVSSEKPGKEALKQRVSSILKFLETNDSRLSDVCYTSAVCKQHHDNRVVFTAPTMEIMKQRLTAYVERDESASATPIEGVVEHIKNIGKLVFFCSSDGMIALEVGKQLWETSEVYRARIRECSEIVERHFGWSLVDSLYGEKPVFLTPHIAKRQTTIFSIQVAICDVYRSAGVVPDVLLAFCFGDFLAAYLTGLMDLESILVGVSGVLDAASKTLRGTGQVFCIYMKRDLLETEIAALGLSDQINIVEWSSCTRTLCSGPKEAFTKLRAIHEPKGIAFRDTGVDIAWHSKYIDHFRSTVDSASEFIGIHPKSMKGHFYSSIGYRFDNESTKTLTLADFWWSHCRETLHFDDAIDSMYKENPDIDAFLEINMYGVNAQLLRLNLNERNKKYILRPALDRDVHNETSLIGNLATLFVNGRNVNWDIVYPADKYLQQRYL
eukprot:gene2255-2555_t